MEKQKGSSSALDGGTNTTDNERQQSTQPAPTTEIEDRSPTILELDTSKIQIEKYRDLALLLNAVPQIILDGVWKSPTEFNQYFGAQANMGINDKQRDDVLLYIGRRICTLGEELTLWGDRASTINSMRRTGRKEAQSVLQDMESWKVTGKQLEESRLLEDELLQMWRKVSVVNTKLADQKQNPCRGHLKRKKMVIDDVEEGIAKLQQRVKRLKDI